MLKITALKNGKPFQAYVRVYRQDEEDYLASGYTDPPRPYSLRLLPGVYDIKVQNRDAPNRPEVKLNGISIKSGLTENLTANF